MRWKFMQLPPEENDKSKSKSLQGQASHRRLVWAWHYSLPQSADVFVCCFFLFVLYIYHFLVFVNMHGHVGKCWRTLDQLTEWLTDWMTDWLTDGSAAAGWMNELVTDLRPRPITRPPDALLILIWTKLYETQYTESKNSKMLI